MKIQHIKYKGDPVKVELAKRDQLGRLIHKTYATKSEVNPFIYIEKVEDYLYETTYTALEYEYAKSQYEANKVAPILGACSSARSGNFHGRSYDWYYGNDGVFIIRTPRSANRYASIGIAGCDSTLSKEFVESKEYSDKYRLLPFRMLDGINEHGLVANINVVPMNDNKNLEVNPTGLQDGEEPERVCMFTIVRYVLDHYKTVAEAIADLQRHVQLYQTTDLINTGYELHLMISDETETKVVEFIDGHYNIVDSQIMTNFHLTGALNENKSINMSTIELFGSGLERYDIMYNYLNQINGECNKDDMRELVNKVLYSQTYTELSGENPWYTEFVGKYGDFIVTTHNASEKLTDKSYDVENNESIMDKLPARWENKQRGDHSCWITVHNCVYDIKNKKMYLMVQDIYGSQKEYELALDVNSEQEIDMSEYEAKYQELENKYNQLLERISALEQNGVINTNDGQPDSIIGNEYVKLNAVNENGEPINITWVPSNNI